MSHRVHPKIYRIKELSDWLSRWQNKKNFAKDLEEDFKIRYFLENELKDCGLESVEIEKFPKKIVVIINSSRPGLIIGRGGKGVEELKQKIEKKIENKEKRQIKIEIKEIRDPWIKASLTSQWIASQIEKRVSYRKALKQGLDKILAYKEVKGARVEVSGRLDGKEIARREWLRKGRLPRQTIRADIDYGTARARCSYGTVGVKVWVYKGDKF